MRSLLEACALQKQVVHCTMFAGRGAAAICSLNGTCSQLNCSQSRSAANLEVQPIPKCCQSKIATYSKVQVPGRGMLEVCSLSNTDRRLWSGHSHDYVDGLNVAGAQALPVSRCIAQRLLLVVLRLLVVSQMLFSGCLIIGVR